MNFTGASIVKKAVENFSVLNVAKLAEKNAAEVAKLGEVCRGDGFFYLKNHGISDAIVKQTSDVGRAFFSLPTNEKDMIHMNKSPHFRGYSHVDAEVTLGVPDHKETLDFAREKTANPRHLLEGPNQWPSEEAVLGIKGFKAAMLQWLDETSRVAKVVVEALAVAHNLDELEFTKHFEDPTVFFRMLRYPPQPSTDAPRIGVGEHTDYGCLTLIYQDAVGGLQAQRAGEWVDVVPIPGTFVVNLGDMLAAWSGGALKATPHRVMNPSSDKERLSLATFFDPNLDTKITVMPKLASAYGNNSLELGSDFKGYSIYSEYLLKKWQQSYPEHPSSPAPRV